MRKLAKQAIRYFRPKQTTQAYWEKRQHNVYYQIARALVSGFGRKSGSLIDVGSAGCPYLDWFPQYPIRTSLDLSRPYAAEGVQSIRANFLEWEPDRRYDVAMSLQVMEHVPDARAFAQKLLSIADIVVVSVPYKWPHGVTKSHVHDPVDEAKMLSWFEREPDFEYVCTEANGVRRLMQAYL